jgi:hypothetical protein
MFDARDAFRGDYFAAVISVDPTSRDAGVALAAIDSLLFGTISLLVIVASDVAAVRQLLAMGEPTEMLSVVTAIDSGRLHLWSSFDARLFPAELAARRSEPSGF